MLCKMRSVARMLAGLATVAFVAAESQPLRFAERVSGAVIGSLVADSLCLGSHYEYDAKKIAKAYGHKPIDRLLAPGEKLGGKTHGVGWGSRNYHPGRKAGEHTDYGDNVMYMLEYFAKHSEGDVTPFSMKHYYDEHWADQYKGWESGSCRACGAWIDTMVKHVLTNTRNGAPLHRAGGYSNAQVVRFPAALGVYSHEGDLLKAAQESTRLTNHHPEPVLAAAFWARVAFRVTNGDTRSLQAIMEEVAGVMGNEFISTKLQQAIAKVREATDDAQPLSKEKYVDDLALTSMARLWDVGKSEPIKVGKASPTEGTLPGAIYFILKYGKLAEAARANAMVGGDNASRATPIGMVLGAREGLKGIPEHWAEQLKQHSNVVKLVQQLPLVKSAAKTAHTEL